MRLPQPAVGPAQRWSIYRLERPDLVATWEDVREVVAGKDAALDEHLDEATDQLGAHDITDRLMDVDGNPVRPDYVEGHALATRLMTLITDAPS